MFRKTLFITSVILTTYNPKLAWAQNAMVQVQSAETKFLNVQNLDLKLGHCELSIVPSNTSETKIVFLSEGHEEFDFSQEDEQLFLHRRRKEKILGIFGGEYLSNRLIKLKIFVAPSVKKLQYSLGCGFVNISDFHGDILGRSGSADITIKNVEGYLDLSTGGVKVDITDIAKRVSIKSGSFRGNLSNIGGETILSTGSFNGEVKNVKDKVSVSTGSFRGNLTDIGGETSLSTGSFKGEIRNVKGNLKLDSGGIEVNLMDILGNVNIKCGSCNLNYSMNTKPDFPIYFKVHSGSFSGIVNLTDSFSSLRNALKRTRIKKSFVPILDKEADINFVGSTASGKISINRIEKKP